MLFVTETSNRNISTMQKPLSTLSTTKQFSQDETMGRTRTLSSTIPSARHRQSEKDSQHQNPENAPCFESGQTGVTSKIRDAWTTSRSHSVKLLTSAPKSWSIRPGRLRSSTWTNAEGQTPSIAGTSSTLVGAYRPKLKLVFVGDDYCGKSSLLGRVCECNHPISSAKYVPTVFYTHIKSVQVDDIIYDVELCDTSGHDAFDRYRPITYSGADAYIMCFDISDHSSLENIQTKWMAEIQQFSDGRPIFLFGCKQDLRNDESRQSVSNTEAEDMRASIGALAYLKTSGRTGDGCTTAIELAVRGTLKWKSDSEDTTNRPCRRLMRKVSSAILRQ